ncbi:MAG TPA: 3-hydroxyacyl-ACP dehydratase FabZ family protein [Pirellulales bacterium]|jgi:3-hydroxyacyl-[acyl-carrier-protein] dehydratase|nr:3-hydroxyacyl-ACP dehydratase FabZ family protein [Pirellulales bacterium]
MSLAEIHAAIPHRPPFLLLDEIVSCDAGRIVCRKTFSPSEPFYAGHYPHFPLTPGVLLCEAGMQAGAVLISRLMEGKPAGVPVATRMNDVRFKQMVKPGDTIDIEVELIERLADAFFLRAKILCGGKAAVRFEFACALATVG